MPRVIVIPCLILAAMLSGTARADTKSEALVLGVLLLTDNNTARWVRGHSNFPTARRFAENLSRYGDPWKLTGACLVASQRLSDGEQQTRYKLAATAAVETGAITGILKLATHRRRPEEKFARETNPKARSNYTSFPSGHTSGDFAIFTALAQQDGRHRGLYLGVAGLVGLSRIYLGRDYASDVFAGAVIGTLVAKHAVARDRGLLSWRF